MNGHIASALVIVAALGVVGTYAASVAKPTCGGTTSSKNINLVQPTNPPRECEYHINAYSKNVCQLRIDFAMTLAQPTVQEREGTDQRYVECTQDFFEVNGLRLCGVETWQHIYVPFNATSGVSRIDLLISLANRAGSTGLPTPEWDMTVTQLECPAGSSVRSVAEETETVDEEPLHPQARATITDGFFVAPPGCLQYFPQASGAVKSFNYNDGAGIYPSNLNYAICFRRTTATNALRIRMYYFHVGAEEVSGNLLTDNSCYHSGAASNPGDDFLMVPEAVLTESNEAATYFCGAIQKDAVITSNNPGPLVVLFKSDEIYKAKEAGFAFTYTVE
ncbi:uncharacterized protein LOC115633695 [Scaptodrosophila lebanonensis]|uniref:Uncharacterized protein LOC115633695 n=1 Tax=Drosophila lebanonensis TaxID=7225 RepID=A0A6J2UIG9_DROLE|nr:uncharacterized protein LOC115633695 [Scaptodrosophila lebanonensis]